jgi:hypothetical protein
LLSRKTALRGGIGIFDLLPPALRDDEAVWWRGFMCTI